VTRGCVSVVGTLMQGHACGCTQRANAPQAHPPEIPVQRRGVCGHRKYKLPSGLTSGSARSVETRRGPRRGGVGPGIPRGLRSDQPVSLLDLAPTLLTLVGAPVPPSVSGRDLAPLWMSPGAPWPERDLFAEANHAREAGGPQRAVLQGRWKLVLHGNGERELFDLAEDPGERVNRAAAEAELAADLANQLTTNLGSVRQAPALPKLEPTMRMQLEALGYLRE
jgi:N-sulphoglucosamine sulphohydrolase, C-terminal